MYNEEKLDASRKRAETAKENRKNPPQDAAEAAYDEKDMYVRPVIRFLEEEIPNMIGVIKDPDAWEIMNDGNTYYLHSLEGTEVECAYTITEDSYCVHMLNVCGIKYLKDKNKYYPFPVEKEPERKSGKPFVAIACVIVAALFAWLIIEKI